MKPALPLLLVLLAAPFWSGAQVPQATVAERGPHHRVWQWTTQDEWPGGAPVGRQHRVVELATGLHYWDGKDWADAQEVIEPFAEGAVARHGQHKAIFAPNLNTRGAIDLETPDGHRLQSHVLGLAYTDTATGKSVLIAEIQDCVGEILPPNQVLYRDAFKDVNASVRYTYTLAGLEQDVLLHQSPASPSAYGLNPATTRLEIFTEFLDPPQPVKSVILLGQETDPVARQRMLLPDFTDETLDFGATQIGPGRAFPLGDDAQPTVPVGKTWQRMQGRDFLIEAVEYPAVFPALETLPQASVPDKARLDRIKRTAQADKRPGQTAALARDYPPTPSTRTTTQQPMRLAEARSAEKALVLDYQTLNGSLTNYTFKADTTYYISAATYLYGTNNVLEGGTVLKYKANAGATLNIKGALVCATDTYRPAILTAKDDRSVGEGTGSATLTGGYASVALDFDAYTSGLSATLTNVRIAYAVTALRFYRGTGHEARHIQMHNCGTGVNSDNTDYAMRNVMLWNVTNAMTGSGALTTTGCWEHATFNQVTNLVSNTTACLTNCLLTAVVSTNSFSGESNIVLASATGVYKTVGGGQHYLADSSPYRNLGTVNIHSDLAGELSKRTTYAPVVLISLSGDTTLTPQAGRDTDMPDPGFHYAPLDYWGCGVNVASNVTVLATNGVAIGMDYSSNSWAFILKSARFLSEGSPTLLNHVVRAHVVQELSGGNPGSRACFYDGTSLNASNELRLRHTELTQLANDSYLLYSGQKFRALEWSHCSLYNLLLVVDTAGSSALVCGVTNTLWERNASEFGLSTTTPGVLVHLRNNLYRNHTLHFVSAATNWTVRDTMFETATVDDHSSPLTNSHNAYFQATNLFTGGGTSNVLLTNWVYQVGPLGRYYQPSNSPLINVGSQNATNAGLYHFTTTTNQMKETNSTVDIGLHYVAVTNIASQWVPIDTDGDGLADYIEDANGNGTVNSGETDWTNATDPGLKVWITKPRQSSALP